MAARIIGVLLMYTTSVIIRLITANRVDDAGIGFQFLLEPKDLIAVDGKSAVLACIVQNTSLISPTSITWVHNNSYIQSDSRRYVSSNGSLIFEKVLKNNINESDAGLYHCVAKGGNFSLVSKSAVLKIAEISSFFVHPQNVTAVIGETVRLFCQLNSVPKAEIIWIFQNTSLTSTSEYKKYDLSLTGVLYITDVQFNDSGKYRCIGRNYLLNLSETSNVGVLTVNPAISEYKNSIKVDFVSPFFPKSLVVREKEDLVLECAVTGLAKVDMVWKRKSYESENHVETINHETEARHSILRKSEVTVQDNGRYTCSVLLKNVEVLSQSVNVDVITPPVIISLDPISQTVPLARGLRFTCNANGHPQPVISWLHNGIPVNQGARWSKTENELIFKSSVSTDSGIYQCVATNEFGSASAASLLLVDNMNKPNPPHHVHCNTVNSTAIFVSWKAPSGESAISYPPMLLKGLNESEENDDEDEHNHYRLVSSSNVTSPTTIYTVSYHTYGNDETLTVSQNEWLTLTNLEPNKTYSIYVRSYNQRSGSETSENVTCETYDKDIDETPITKIEILDKSPRHQFDPHTMLIPNNNVPHLQLTQINKTTLEVSWNMDKPKINNDEYVIVYKKENDETSTGKVNVTFQQQNVLLYNLEPNTNYNISMKIIVNGTEAEFATDSVKMLPELNSFIEVQVEPLSLNTIKVSWESIPNIKIANYTIIYRHVNSNMSNVSNVEHNCTEKKITNLKAGSVYTVQLQFHDVNGRHFLSNSVQIRTFPILEKMRYQRLNSSTFRVSWVGSKGDTNVNETYIVTCKLNEEENCSMSSITVSDNEYHVNIFTGEKKGKYTVVVRPNMIDMKAKMSRSMAEKLEKIVNYMSRKITFNETIKKLNESVSILGIRLTKEQGFGVLIGLGIGGLFIFICVLTLYICKKHFEKHYRHIYARSRIISPDDKHEMKTLSKRPVSYRTPFPSSNGSNLSAHLPLLCSNGTFRNGLIPNTRIGENGECFDSDAKMLRGERDKFLSSSSPVDETCLTTIDTTYCERSREQEGGDSGYCDRNHSQSPQLKDCDSTQRLRKYSDLTTDDDGFCENEVADIKGTSPNELPRGKS